MDIEKGGLIKPAPIKTHLEALLARFFAQEGLGDKNNLGKFFKNRVNFNSLISVYISVKQESANRGWGEQFNQNLSYGYSALLEVFKYLSLKERSTAAKVCRLWRDVSLHHSLWKNISLKNTRIHDWQGFVKFFNNTKANSLDMRKMLFVKVVGLLLTINKGWQ